MTQEQLTELLNTDVGKIIVVVAGVIALTIIILGNTSIGRKSLIELRAIGKSNTKSCVDTQKVVDDFKQEQVETLKTERDFYKSELAVVKNEFDKFKEFVMSALGKVDNLKVKKEINKYLELDTKNCDTDKILEEIDKVATIEQNGVKSNEE